MRIALYQPDIPQNAGAVLRLAACLNLGVDIIEPCGFLWDDRKLRRAGMDYRDLAEVVRHTSWTAFQATRKGLEAPPRLVLLSTRGTVRHVDFAFREDDILLLGRESVGVPDEVHAAADATVAVPLATNARSLNVAMAGAMVAGQALGQMNMWPQFTPRGREMENP